MKLTVVLPVFNEEENIALIPEVLLPELKNLGCDYEILLIDDGSKDKSVEVARSLNIPELKIIRHEKNKGIGAAVKTAIREASGELTVILDSDFTFHPRYIKDLLDRYKKGDVDFVIGSPRLASFEKEIKRYRVLISITASAVYSALLGRKITAVSPIFRLYKTSQLRELDIKTDGFDISVEILFKMVISGRTFAEVPTPLGVRKFGVSKLNYKKEIIRHLFLVRKIMVWRLKNLVEKFLHNIFVSHRFALLVAVLVGIIYFLPNILIPLLQEKNELEIYHPMSLQAPVLDEVAAYGSRLREVMDGHFADGDAYLREYKNRPTMWGSDVMALMLGTFPYLVGLKDPTPIFVFGDLFFPALIFLSAYALFFSIIKNKFWSILGALIFSVFPNISVFRSLLSPHFYTDFSFLKFYSVFERLFDFNLSRLFVPGFSLIFFILFLFAVLRALRAEKINFFPLEASLAFGILFYIYFYYWAFATVFLAILTAIFLFSDKKRAILSFKILIGGFIVSLPYWIKMLSLRQNPLYAELSARVGLEHSRNFRLSSLDAYIFAIVLFIFLLWLGSKHKQRVISIFLGAALLSYIVVLNVQIFTGFNVQPDHWGSRVNVYILSFSIITSLFWFLEYFRKKFSRQTLIPTSILVSLIAFLISIAFIFQIRSAYFTANNYRIRQDLLNSFKWINYNIPKDSVFLASSSKTTFYLPFFTHANVYVPPACYSLLPRDQIIDRFLSAYAYFGVPKEFLRKSLEANLGDGSNIDFVRGAENDPIYMLFCDTFADYKPGGYIYGNSLRPFPIEVLDELMAKYEAKLSSFKGKKSPFKKGQADFIFWGPNEKAIGTKGPDQYENTSLIYKENLVEIYELLP